ncbi:unnamed protein product [Schistocephalus solidus]|uniref:RNA helicase n=1 Tax=Schistocephalus solidus TaxID=70667 RepID=A0A183T016_SCHSO|nr:unnamed protein product [Schistocephalus solidus]
MSSGESESDIDVAETRALVKNANRKKRKAGGFQAMGLSNQLFKSIARKGYKMPTPIQRKVIPVILSGRDLVAMSRTGSGKTAAFLIPILERLNLHQDTGARALLLSPTRELAMQTLAFTRELGKFTNLVTAVIVGGDKIIATPGRLLHIVMEMNIQLKSIDYVVFDEGDRLFEMGFADQLTEILHRLPSKRQTLIFSATLPGALLEFARAGLSDPALVRLDVDAKLSSLLQMAFISCLPFEKEALLIHMLNTVIRATERVVIFLATKHHVDFLEAVRCSTVSFLHLFANFPAGPRVVFPCWSCAVVHSGLDPVARTMAVKNFKAKRVRCLLVTDLAARGIDIPLLDNVINFHFPGQPKLFIHRVGRVARAGRAGMAISFVDSDELPYLVDLFVFLGRRVITRLPVDKHQQPAAANGCPTAWTNELLGTFPRDALRTCQESIAKRIADNATLASAAPVCKRALSKYVQTRPRASAESVRRAKEIRSEIASLPVHPIFSDETDTVDTQKESILQMLRNRRLPTIFEALGKHANPEAFQMIMRKRKLHDPIISRAQEMQSKRAKQAEDHSEEIIAPAKDSTFFVPSAREDEVSERGLSTRTQDAVGGSFVLSAEAASFDVQGDEVGISHGRPAGFRKTLQVWDRKHKRFVNSDVAAGKANVARIKTESGVYIPASYKTDKYETWLKRSKVYLEPNQEQEAGAPRVEESRKNVACGTVAARNAHSKEPKTPFTSLFNAKYGSVVEFMDVEEETDKSHLRGKRRFKTPAKKEKQTGSEGAEGTSGGLKVVGTLSRSHTQHLFFSFERTAVSSTLLPPFYPLVARNAHKRMEQAAREANKNIRQAKGSRTFGQTRKPEQILKQRRKREKQNNFARKNKGKKGGGSGGVFAGRKGGGGKPSKRGKSKHH